MTLGVLVLAHNSGELEVTAIDVQPSMIRSGETVAISATITNHTGAIVHDSRILVAVANRQSTERNWKVVLQEPSAPITFTLNESINFRAVVQILGDGSFEIGIAGAGPDARFEPTGKLVHVINTGIAVREIATTFIVFLIPMTLVVVAIATLRRAPKANTNRRLIVIGVVLMAIAVLMWRWITIFFNQIPYQFSNLIAYAGMFLFLCGWLVAGASLKLGGSWRRSLAIAAIAYFVIGVLWTVLRLAGFSAQRLYPVLSSPFQVLNASIFAWIWPFQVGQVLGFIYFAD